MAYSFVAEYPDASFRIEMIRPRDDFLEAEVVARLYAATGTGMPWRPSSSGLVIEAPI